MLALVGWWLALWPVGPAQTGAGQCVPCAWANALQRPGLTCAVLDGAGRAWDRAHGHAEPFGLWGLSSVGDPLVASHLLRGVTYTQSPAQATTWLRTRGGLLIVVQPPGEAGHALYCYGLRADGRVACQDSRPAHPTTLTYPAGQWLALPGFWAAIPLPPP